MRARRRKQRRRRAVYRAITAAGHLVQGAERQPAFWKTPVDLLDAEGQHGPPARDGALEALDALTKFLDNRRGGGRSHVPFSSLGK